MMLFRMSPLLPLPSGPDATAPAFLASTRDWARRTSAIKEPLRFCSSVFCATTWSMSFSPCCSARTLIWRSILLISSIRLPMAAGNDLAAPARRDIKLPRSGRPDSSTFPAKPKARCPRSSNSWASDAPLSAPSSVWYSGKRLCIALVSVGATAGLWDISPIDACLAAATMSAG